jgi:hypothetical protein
MRKLRKDGTDYELRFECQNVVLVVHLQSAFRPAVKMLIEQL